MQRMRSVVLPVHLLCKRLIYLPGLSYRHRGVVPWGKRADVATPQQFCASLCRNRASRGVAWALWRCRVAAGTQRSLRREYLGARVTRVPCAASSSCSSRAACGLRFRAPGIRAIRMAAPHITRCRQCRAALGRGGSAGSGWDRCPTYRDPGPPGRRLAFKGECKFF